MIPVTTPDGSKLFVSGPCIVLKTQTSTPTVAQQVQALRPLLKADSNTAKNTTTSNKIKTSDRNNNNSNNADDSNNGNAISDVAPKNSPGSNVENEPEALRCKRRIDFSSLGLPRPQPAAMARRNERERNRVKQVNLGFETLRQHVPQGRKNKKLSKVDTLKEAVKYIKYLHQLLLEADQDADAGLTTAISDTITMVSRPTTTTTASSPVTATATETSAAVTASTNTAAITTTDLMQLAASAKDASTTMDLSCGIDNSLVPESVDFQSSNASVLKIDNGLTLSDPVNFGDVAQLASVHDYESVSQLGSDSLDMGNDSPSHLVELAPAQLNYGSPSSTAMDMDPVHIAIDAAAALPILPTFSTANPPTLTFLNFNNSATSSPDSSPQDPNQAGCLPEYQSLRADKSCGGSEGSCPVSPSESSGASEMSQEDAMGMSGGESWQDLSADIAEWLCSKIDIEDPDVFV